MVTFSQQTPAPTASARPASGGSKSGSKLLPLVVVVVVLAVIGGGFWFLKGRGGGGISSEYKGVYLTNGRAYYGKIVDESANDILLRDVYYLVVVNPSADSEATQQAQPRLIKLGGEISGPMDEIRVNREQVLYIETLKEDGQVVQAIRKYQEQLKQQPQE
jgi:flagellar basal body-associated protein FliL